MKILEVKNSVFPEVKVIRYGRFPDERGFFAESFRKSDLINSGIFEVGERREVLQVNNSYSKKGVIRGFHFQWKPDMDKLIQVVDGEMIDLFLDIRKNSPTYGKIGTYRLESNSTKNENAIIWIPAGFAHGVAFLKDSYIEYYCTAEYSPSTEAGISPYSPDINWFLCDPALKKEFDEIAQKALISDKDKQGLTTTQWQNDPRSENFVY